MAAVPAAAAVARAAGDDGAGEALGGRLGVVATLVGAGEAVEGGAVVAGTVVAPVAGAEDAAEDAAGDATGVGGAEVAIGADGGATGGGLDATGATGVGRVGADGAKGERPGTGSAVPNGTVVVSGCGDPSGPVPEGAATVAVTPATLPPSEVGDDEALAPDGPDDGVAPACVGVALGLGSGAPMKVCANRCGPSGRCLP